MDRYDDERDERQRRRNGESRRGTGELGRRRESLIQRRIEGRDEEWYDDFAHEPPPSYAGIGGHAPPYRRQPTGCAASVLYFMLGLLAIVLVLLLAGPRIMGGIMGSIASSVPERVSQVIATPTPTVRDRGGTIQQIRSLNRLETQSFAVERVVEASVQRGNALDLVLGERLLLIASGNVIAGVDLSKLTASDVTISSDGGSITLNLPPSEIFLSALDNTRTRVYDKQTGIGTRLIGGENKDLETQARQNAEVEILRAACEGGVMQKAADEARRSMEQFLQLLEFERINVNAPAGPCVAPDTVPTLPAQTP